jgi:hypothetical protein
MDGMERHCAMNILIVAIDHELQKVKRVHEARERAVRKDQLEALLKQEIAERNVEFISEESDPNALTIAHQLADARKPRIPWKNICMSEDERRKAGIYEALKNRPTDFGLGEDGDTVLIERRIPEDEIYEASLIEQTKKGAGGAQSILIVCGDLHVDALKEKLERQGHHVDSNHSLVEKGWA